MISLSVILPMYNVEPFVDKCIRSLEDQDIPSSEFEIICVNDGSPDNSREVVLHLQKEFENIILIDQYNQGVSMARNNGAAKAIGKYLMFIDPDDTVHSKSLGRIIRYAITSNAQVIIPGYTFVDFRNSIIGHRTYGDYEMKLFSGIRAYHISRETGEFLGDIAIGILFEADFLKTSGLFFLAEVPYLEDGEFLARVHCIADRCVFINQESYIKKEQPGSAMNSNLSSTEKARIGFRKSAQNLKRFQEDMPLRKEQVIFLNESIAQFVMLSLMSALDTRSLKKIRNSIGALKSSGLGKLNLKGCKGWHLICGYPYNLSPFLGILVMTVYFKLNYYNDKLKGDG